MMWEEISSADGLISGYLVKSGDFTNKPLLVCIHGGGCNGRYFDLKGNSVMGAARQRGFPVLLVNRPGYHGNDLPAGASPIAGTAPVIRHFAEEVRHGLGGVRRPIALIGHSIGGALALQMASERGDWPLLGVAVSGIGDVSPPVIGAIQVPPGLTKFQPPQEFTDALFFDPDRSLSWKAVASLRAAAEPWLVSEVVDVVRQWPGAWPDVARKIDVAVHLRLAEHERIWETGQKVVDRMAARLSSAPRLDVDLLRGGGHLYEATKHGQELIRAQLDFFESCAAAAR
jgi:pimeloyl-ACP methyl ester carboxylesterase